MQDLVAASGERLSEAARGRALEPATIGIDEFSALGADHVIALLARGRESGRAALVATQELADLDRAAPGFRDQVLGVTAVKIVHRQDVPESARTIAQMVGTEGSGRRPARSAGRLLGGHDTGRGTRRQVERFIVHPNEIKTLRTGEAVVISKIGGPATADRLRVGAATRTTRAGVAPTRWRASRPPARSRAPPADATADERGPTTHTNPSGSSPSASKQWQLVARHVNHVPLPHLVRLLAQGDPRTAGDDHHAVVVGVPLARGPPARGHLEVAHPVLARALGLADQLVLAHARERGSSYACGSTPSQPASDRSGGGSRPGARLPAGATPRRASPGRRRTPRRCCAGG